MRRRHLRGRRELRPHLHPYWHDHPLIYPWRRAHHLRRHLVRQHAAVGGKHHRLCFSMWLAGGGIKKGYVHGETDDFSYNITRDPVHVHDLNATILHLLGIDHERLVYPYQGRDFRLTDVHGNLVKDILA